LASYPELGIESLQLWVAAPVAVLGLQPKYRAMSGAGRNKAVKKPQAAHFPRLRAGNYPQYSRLRDEGNRTPEFGTTSARPPGLGSRAVFALQRRG
jgi:hypothetical protein